MTEQYPTETIYQDRRDCPNPACLKKMGMKILQSWPSSLFPNSKAYRVNWECMFCHLRAFESVDWAETDEEALKLEAALNRARALMNEDVLKVTVRATTKCEWCQQQKPHVFAYDNSFICGDCVKMVQSRTGHGDDSDI